MISSMTAFARQQQQTEWGSLCWELRSVNHRFLEFSPRLPEELRALEPELRERAGAAIKRGKLDCTLRLQTDSAKAAQKLHINADAVQELARACNEVAGMMGASASPGALDVLRWPGVVQASEIAQERLGTQALALFDAALKELVSTRQREGARLAAFLEQRRRDMQQVIAQVCEQLPRIQTEQRVKLTQRLLELKAGFDPARIEQEMLMLLQKMDVEEEIARLQAHLDEMERVMSEKGPGGRRLDFLMQELGREANTLGSKSVDLATTRASIELKVLIEQAREQIQNIE
ncbi:MAG: YicC family protein [Gammaproteobacteria bacterium]|nr:YicC family protein [Gammaproteobacteria bacterium]